MFSVTNLIKDLNKKQTKYLTFPNNLGLWNTSSLILSPNIQYGILSYTNITLIRKPDKETSKRKLQSNTSHKYKSKNINKPLAIQIQQHVQKFICHDMWDLSKESKVG